MNEKDLKLLMEIIKSLSVDAQYLGDNLGDMSQDLLNAACSIKKNLFALEDVVKRFDGAELKTKANQ